MSAGSSSTHQCPGDPTPQQGSPERYYIEAAELLFAAGIYAADLRDLIDEEESIIFGKVAATQLTGQWVPLRQHSR